MSRPLAIADVAVHHGGEAALAGVSLDVDDGELVALVGPNGAGKTTLLQAALLGRHDAGSVAWFGRDRRDWSARELTRRVAMLPQRPSWSQATVAEHLAVGRRPYWGAFGSESSADRDAVAAVADRLDLTPLLRRGLDTLSGGERQRVLIGRALVQIEGQPEAALLLDEPDLNLDLARVAELGGLVRDVAAAGRGVLMASHDLNLAAAVADRVVLLVAGRVVAAGKPGDVLRADRLGSAYGDAVSVVGGAIVPRVTRAERRR